MSNIARKSFGQVVDEYTISKVREDHGGSSGDFIKYIQYFELYPHRNNEHLYDLTNRLHDVNSQIWDLIDFVMMRRTLIQRLRDVFRLPKAAVDIQRLNRMRTDLIREIDQHMGCNRTVPEKVYD